MKKPENEKAYLSWTKKDYIEANEEIPEKLLHNEVHTEGELMSEDEIIAWILDTQKTFFILKETDKELYDKLYKGFLLDLEYLVKIGKINEEDIDEILNLDEFK